MPGGLSGARRHGASSCFEDPAVAAHEASVFWHGSAYPHVVPVRFASQRHEVHDQEGFELTEFRSHTVVLRTPDRTEHILFQHPFGSIQLVARGRSVLGKNLCATFEIHGLSRTKTVTGALLTLAQMKDDLPVSDGPATTAWPDANSRLRTCLVALDGSLNSASYRQIARVIYGPERVLEDWTGESRYLKERMRRAVESGRELMDGGYRKLLA
jgi:hypothetical protein